MTDSPRASRLVPVRLEVGVWDGDAARRAGGADLALRRVVELGGRRALPGPETAVLGGYARCAPTQKRHRKPICIGKREGALRRPGGARAVASWSAGPSTCARDPNPPGVLF
jgi:hypothetical protein